MLWTLAAVFAYLCWTYLSAANDSFAMRRFPEYRVLSRCAGAYLFVWASSFTVWLVIAAPWRY